MKLTFSRCVTRTESVAGGSAFTAAASRRRAAAAVGALAMVATFAGCGSASTSPQPAKGVTVQAITLKSPVIPLSGALPARYTCTTALPPLTWGKLPKGTASLALGVFELTEVERTPQGTYRAKISFPHASIASLSPKLHSLASNAQPRGAVRGPGHFSFCPAKGSTGYYLIRLFALGSKPRVVPGFNEGTYIKNATTSALGAGSLAFHYKHR
jgi:phosphatidylethanolamine-binding protein (PEBP) family uncharacterized protein